MLCGSCGLLAACAGWWFMKTQVDEQRKRQSTQHAFASEINAAVGGNPFSSLFAMPYCRVCMRLRRGRVPRRLWRDWRRLYRTRIKGWTDPHDGWWSWEHPLEQDTDA